MKKHLALYIFILIFVLTGCATNVSVSYMRPSEVNTGRYRNMAIASTVPYKGRLHYPEFVRYIDVNSSRITISTSYSRTLPRDVSEYATRKLLSTLSETGYFNILPPKETDKYLSLGDIGYNPSKELLKNGYDAVMIPKIENMDIDEYIGSIVIGVKVDENGVKIPELEFYLKRVASIKYSITIIDCRTDKVISKKVFTDSYEMEEEFDPKFPSFSSDGYYLFKRMINGFQKKILSSYVPSKIVEKLPLMSNKPKVEAVENAYSLAKDGALTAACSLFTSEWESSGHIPSGYNSALLMSAMGDYDSALELLKTMIKRGANRDVEKLYRELLARQKSTIEADKQISGIADSDKYEYGYTIYDYVINN